MSRSLAECRVAVVGGGPAGLLAAEVLACAGVGVTVYERMPTPGRKLLVAGRGGLNLTHAEPLEPFLDRYGPARDCLAPAITAFDPDALREWCAGLGQETFVGTSGRVFPAGFRSTALLRAWLARLDGLGVELRGRHTWRGWVDDEPGAVRIERPDGVESVVRADAVVLALGGASWPRTGSDGGWVEPVGSAGVAVVPLVAANSGFTAAWTSVFIERFAGTPVKNVAVAHRGQVARGDLMVSATGLEGGPIYALGPSLRASMQRDGEAVVIVDLRPDVSADALVDRLARGRAGDSTASALRRLGVAPAAVGLMREATANRLPPRGRALAELVKAVPMALGGPAPIGRAISTAGGIAFDELDDAYMLRRRPGTFVAGEMLDWEAPTGGYLLQATASTAVAAARGALAWLRT
ncbi:MAG: TIGR03862 family flavoprotein [Acidimicrobiales bacterium]